MPNITVQTSRTIDLPDTAFDIDGTWFVPRDEDGSKKYAKVQRILDAVRNAVDENGNNVPVEFKEIARMSGENYPQDVQAAMQALNILGRVKAYQAINPETGSPRASVFYKWVVDEDMPSTDTNGTDDERDDNLPHDEDTTDLEAREGAGA